MLSKQLAAARTRRASYPLVISNIRVPSVASVVLPVIRVIRVHSWLNGTSLTASHEGQIGEWWGKNMQERAR